MTSFTQLEDRIQLYKDVLRSLVDCNSDQQLIDKYKDRYDGLLSQYADVFNTMFRSAIDCHPLTKKAKLFPALDLRLQTDIEVSDYVDAVLYFTVSVRGADPNKFVYDVKWNGTLEEAQHILYSRYDNIAAELFKKRFEYLRINRDE